MPSAIPLDGPAAKRRKLSQDLAVQRPASHTPRIFAPFRTVGLVTPTSVPFTAVPLGKSTFQITTSVGKSLHTYDLSRGLSLVFITRPQTPGIISATAAWADRVAAAWSSPSDRGIWIFKRGRRIGELQMPPSVNEDIVQLVVFGSWIVACCQTKIEVWSAETTQHHTTLQTNFDTFNARNVLTGGICTMPTYTNKIFAGREDGTVEIWNVGTGKLVYRIPAPSSETGPVTSLESSPAVSILAIAYLGGQLILKDVQFDKTILRFRAGSSKTAPITSISFRTDGLGAGQDGKRAGVMATVSYGSGDVTLWDLNNGGRRLGTLRSAHDTPEVGKPEALGGISKIEFLPGQSIMITSGFDNALKSWIFDETPTSPIPRILHGRSGHAAAITTLNFLPNDSDGFEAGGKWLLSTSKDRSLWAFSLRRDGQSTELSQGTVSAKAKKMVASTQNSVNVVAADLKAPEIISLACALNRDGGMGAMPGMRAIWTSKQPLKGKNTATEQNLTGWESVITGHKDDRFARTWFWGRKRAGRWIFETSDGGNVSSVAISPCGTFALVGSHRGSIDMYNLQSGIHRQRYPPKLTPAQARKLRLEQADLSINNRQGCHQWAVGEGKHVGSVTGLQVDNLNRTVMSCGADGKAKFWDFVTGRLLHQLDWHAQTVITSMKYHRPSDLIALCCEDFCVRVVDTETRKVVRELSSTQATINDFCFSNDGRWVIAACSDCLVRVWDLPTGHLIDAIKLHVPCTALALSNTGEFLALAQEGAVGIDIWTNRTLFTHVPIRQISESEVTVLEGPVTSGEGGQGILASAFENTTQDTQDEETVLPCMTQLSSSVETLSLVPKSRWQTLLNLDLIRERNKPKEAPKLPEKAPFFLPSIQGKAADALEGVADVHAATANNAPPGSRLMRMDRILTESTFSLLLRQQADDEFVEHLKTLAPAAADIEIRSLNTGSPYTELINFVQALTVRLQQKRDYELVQAWMAVFLRCHGEIVDEAASISSAISLWRAEQRKEGERLGKLSGYCAGLIGFLRTAQ